MSRLLLVVLTCASVAFARGPGSLDGKNVTVSAKGRALCSGAPLQGTLQLILLDTQCATCPMAPHMVLFAELKVDNGYYHAEGSVAVPTHGVRGGFSTIYMQLVHHCGHVDPPSFDNLIDVADVPAEYWNVESDRKIFEHDFLVIDSRQKSIGQ